MLAGVMAEILAGLVGAILERGMVKMMTEVVKARWR